MQSAYEMNSDVKALLTLWLLKAGTSPETIQMTVQLAAASRIMVVEEQALPPNDRREPRPVNATKLRPVTDANDAAKDRARLNAGAMHSDIKALLSLALLKVGASSSEIQTTLRLAAALRTRLADATNVPPQSAVTTEPEADIVSITPKQVFRNGHLAPISMRRIAAA